MTLGVTLVTGGCGFVGYHVVKALIEDGSSSSIHVFSRHPSRNRLLGVQYHAGDLRSDDDIRSLLQKIQPNVVFHVAAPISSGNDSNEKVYHDTNVAGTKRLLDWAINTRTVKAFVYTSSSSVVEGPYIFADESRPLLKRSSAGANYYSNTKAVADETVLKANNLGDCLIPGVLKALKDKRQHIQIGDNSNEFDFCSATNAAAAHLLIAKALLVGYQDPKTPKVDGEAFFITDGKPMPFWTFSRKVWAAAGDHTPLDQVKVVPGWFVLGLAITVEWLYWIFSAGHKTPKMLRSHTIRHVTEPRTFSIDKARSRLGYKPADTMEDSIRKGVEWCLKQDSGSSTDVQ